MAEAKGTKVVTKTKTRLELLDFLDRIAANVRGLIDGGNVLIDPAHREALLLSDYREALAISEKLGVRSSVRPA